MLLTLSVFSLSGKWLWSAELASHFKLQYFFLALGVLIFYLGLRRCKYIALNLIALSINVYDIAPLYAQKEISATNNKTQNLTIIQFNRHINNLQDNKVIEWLSDKKNKFDIVLIQEISPSFVQKLKNLAQIYTYKHVTPQKGIFAQALLSKKEIINGKSDNSQEKPSFYITVKIRLSKTKSLQLYGIHTMPPTTPEMAIIRNAQLKIVGKSVSRDLSKTKIAIGDFNVTPFSYYFSLLEKTIGLKNTMIGFGLQNSWPSILPFNILRIPIDHVFVSKNIQIVERRIGPNLGSDHFPVIVTLSL